MSNDQPDMKVNGTEPNNDDRTSESNYYTNENMESYWDQLESNVEGKDKLVLALNSLFLGGISVIFNIRNFNLYGIILLVILSAFFVLSLFFSLKGFVSAEKLSLKKYKIICKGLNEPSKQLSDKKLEKKFRKIDKKYRSKRYDYLAFLFCCIGLIFFPIIVSFCVKFLIIEKNTYQNGMQSIYIYNTDLGEKNMIEKNKNFDGSGIEKGNPYRIPIKSPSPSPSPAPPQKPTEPIKKITDSGRC